VTLTAADVAEIMGIVERSTFDELSLEINGIKLTLRRAGTSGEFIRSITGPSAHADTADAADTADTADGAATRASRLATASAPTAARVAASGPVDANLKEITSPMLGTFYRAPKPGSAPFVEIGSAVDEDTVIAIIEVMKLMNTVRAGVKGIITQILPADETLVEFGDVLMRAHTDP
jgi:acetyl-CoA carboxylase biotin carboxyl carrier protein